MRTEQQANKSEKSSCAYFSYGTVLPKPNFRVVKHAKQCHHVELGIFPPHLHIKFIKFGAMVN